MSSPASSSLSSARNPQRRTAAHVSTTGDSNRGRSYKRADQHRDSRYTDDDDRDAEMTVAFEDTSNRTQPRRFVEDGTSGKRRAPRPFDRNREADHGDGFDDFEAEYRKIMTETARPSNRRVGTDRSTAAARQQRSGGGAAPVPMNIDDDFEDGDDSAIRSGEGTEKNRIKSRDESAGKTRRGEREFSDDDSVDDGDDGSDADDDDGADRREMKDDAATSAARREERSESATTRRRYGRPSQLSVASPISRGDIDRKVSQQQQQQQGSKRRRGEDDARSRETTKKHRRFATSNDGDDSEAREFDDDADDDDRPGAAAKATAGRSERATTIERFSAMWASGSTVSVASRDNPALEIQLLVDDNESYNNTWSLLSYLDIDKVLQLFHTMPMTLRMRLQIARNVETILTLTRDLSRQAHRCRIGAEIRRTDASVQMLRNCQRVVRDLQRQRVEYARQIRLSSTVNQQRRQQQQRDVERDNGDNDDAERRNDDDDDGTVATAIVGDGSSADGDDRGTRGDRDDDNGEEEEDDEDVDLPDDARIDDRRDAARRDEPTAEQMDEFMATVERVDQAVKDFIGYLHQARGADGKMSVEGLRRVHFATVNTRFTEQYDDYLASRIRFDRNRSDCEKFVRAAFLCTIAKETKKGNNFPTTQDRAKMLPRVCAQFARDEWFRHLDEGVTPPRVFLNIAGTRKPVVCNILTLDEDLPHGRNVVGSADRIVQLGAVDLVSAVWRSDKNLIQMKAYCGVYLTNSHALKV